MLPQRIDADEAVLIGRLDHERVPLLTQHEDVTGSYGDDIGRRQLGTEPASLAVVE